MSEIRDFDIVRVVRLDRANVGRMTYVLTACTLLIASVYAGSMSQAGDSPAECLKALSVQRPDDYLPGSTLRRDSAAISLAYELKPRLLEPTKPYRRALLDSLLDSLVASDGRDKVRAAALMLMTKAAPVDPWRRVESVGYVYAAVGADLRYPIGFAFREHEKLERRAFSITAIRYAASLGHPVDTLAADAVAAVVCDMAYATRPFRPNTKAQMEAESQFWYQTADATYRHALITLGLLAGDGSLRALDLLQRYAAWEPNAVMKAIALEDVRRAATVRGR